LHGLHDGLPVGLIDSSSRTFRASLTPHLSPGLRAEAGDVASIQVGRLLCFGTSRPASGTAGHDKAPTGARGSRRPIMALPVRGMSAREPLNAVLAILGKIQDNENGDTIPGDSPCSMFLLLNPRFQCRGVAPWPARHWN
jgi:hypothetical protein